MKQLRTILLVLASASCAADEGGDTTVADTGVATQAEATESGSQSTSGTPTTSNDGDPDDTGLDDDASSTDDPTASTTDAADTATGTESTGEGPTSGPGVLPGEGGLEAFCRRYVECGGTYYADEQACIDAAYDYWGDCATRAAALDEFGACMADIECTDWSPDGYVPASTPCAEQWEGVGASEPC